MPKTPEEWLEAVSPPKAARGSLKVYLGYAPGVGKTYLMLSEAIRRHTRDEDVVIGYVETHGRKGIIELAAQVPMVPRRKLEYKGTMFEEMDVDAIIARKPQVVVVDELAHTNTPGSKHRKRYEDVLELNQAGIEVLTTVNIQHIESIAPVVHSVTGIRIRETVPDWVVEHATEVVMVDLTPEALLNRLRRGDVYRTDKVEQALKNFFRRGNLTALRELALRQVAEQVDRSLESYMTEQDIQEPWAVRERIAVSVSPNAKSQYLIARAARMARRIHADLYVVCVETKAPLTAEAERSLSANLGFAESLGAKVVRLKGKDVASTAASFVREKHITQLVIGRSVEEGWRKWAYMIALNRFLREAPGVDVHMVTQEPD
jgi:two-component system sensor histidine kinase KdpD